MKMFYTLFAMLVGCCFALLPGSTYAQSSGNSADVAFYRVTFTSTWSAETHHHTNFPAGAHFSPLIGATHNLSATFWLSGTLASPGIEQMAETGGTTVLRNEITAVGVAAQETLSGPALTTATGSVTIPTFSASRSHPLVTLVTMIAPSPDWFVGVHDLSLLNEQGQWRDTVVVTLYPYDAGSDDGADYTSADREPVTHQPITEIRGQTPFSTAPIGTFTFTRIQRLYLPILTQQGTAK
jgi:hypothetical protein